MPGMPLDMSGAGADASSCLGDQRRDGAHQDWQQRDWPCRPWWRPSSTVGRVFLGLGVLVVLGALATSAFLLKTYLGRDGRFRIAGAGNIEASGLTEVSRAEMLPVFGEDIGRNVFFVPLAERRKQLEQIPWVERATVMRLLPDRISVQVVERQPVAFTRQGQQIGLVDANGVLLSMPAAMMAQHHYSFPVVTGIDVRDPVAARKARMAVYGSLLHELDANGQHISEQISEIDLSDPQDAQVLMSEQGGDILAHFGEDHFLERYQRYKAHIGEWRQQYPKLAAVDLRYEQQAVLEMAAGTNVAQTTADDQSAASAAAKPAAKPPAAAEPAGKAKLQAGAKPSAPARASAAKSGIKAAKPGAKVGGKSSAKPRRTSPAAQRIAKVEARQKKRAEARHAALNPGKQRTAPTSRPVAVVDLGQ